MVPVLPPSGMIGKEGGSWDRGIVIFDGALGESNEALSMAGNMRLAWYDTDSNDENSALSAFVIGLTPLWFFGFSAGRDLQ